MTADPTLVLRPLRFDLPAGEPEIDYPREERREVGAPQRSTWLLYESAPDGLSAGIWDCEPGRWRIQFGPHKHEYMVVLQGRARLHDSAGGVTELGPGEALMIPPNFCGAFEVLEKVRKHFVILEREGR